MRTSSLEASSLGSSPRSCEARAPQAHLSGIAESGTVVERPDLAVVDRVAVERLVVSSSFCDRASVNEFTLFRRGHDTGVQL